MFVLKETYSFDWPVVVKLPSQETPGAVEEHEFTATFQAIPIEEAKALMARVQQAPPERQGDETANLLRRTVIGWDGDLRAEGGAALPFSEENREKLIGWAFTRLALFLAYNQALNGAEARRLGNSGRPPATGRAAADRPASA